MVRGEEDHRPVVLIQNGRKIFRDLDLSKDYRAQSEKDPIRMSRTTRDVNYGFVDAKFFKHAFCKISLFKSDSSVVRILFNVAGCIGNSTPGGTGSDCNNSCSVLCSLSKGLLESLVPNNKVAA